MARTDVGKIEAYWESPPGPNQGVHFVTRLPARGDHRTRELSVRVSAAGSLTQIEAAALLKVTVMTVNRWVRAGELKDRKVRGKSMIPLSEVKRLHKLRHPPTPGKRIIHLTG